MLQITDGASLSSVLTSSIDPQLKELIRKRVQQLDVHDLSSAARFLIVQAGDKPAALEQALGFPILHNCPDDTQFGEPDYSPGFEWVADHGHTYELVMILTDDGFAHVVFVPNSPGIDAELLNLCVTYSITGADMPA